MSDADFSTMRGMSARAKRPVRLLRLKQHAGLALADAAAVTAATSGLVLVRTTLNIEVAIISLEGWATLAILWGVLFVALNTALGLYSNCRLSPFEQFRQHILACAILSTLVASALGASISLLAVFLVWITIFAGLAAFGIVTRAIAQRLLIRFDLWREPVILVGDSQASLQLARALNASPELGFCALMHIPADSIPSIGSAVKAARQRLFADGQHLNCAIVLSTGDSSADLRLAAELDLPSVLVLRDVGSLQTLWIQSRSVGSAVGVEVRNGLLVPNNLRLKRAFDLVIAVPALIVAAPLVLMAALAIMAIDPGNPFYVQKRAGHRGRTIGVLKLRSMYHDSDARLQAHLKDDPEAEAEWRRHFKLKADPRILPLIGPLIRKSSIDELPQLGNVVLGQMSLVGPRPFPFYHLDAFDAEFRALRETVLPGLSGFWQISERSDGDLEGQRRCDVFYIRNWSIWLDLYILVHTLPVVLVARGAR